VKWTTEKPKEVGFYWAMSSKHHLTTMVKVITNKSDQKLYAESFGDDRYYFGLSEFVAFSGPIPEPEGDEEEVTA